LKAVEEKKFSEQKKKKKKGSVRWRWDLASCLVSVVFAAWKILTTNTISYTGTKEDPAPSLDSSGVDPGSTVTSRTVNTGSLVIRATGGPLEFLNGQDLDR
jgi:hypothetical protein